MEFRETVKENYSSEIALSEEIKGYLGKTAKWAKFISIVGFVFIGLMAFASISMGMFMGSMGSDFGGTEMPFPPILISIAYLLIAFVMLIPILHLYKFANNMQIALRKNDTNALTDSFRNLKSHYKFYGIFTLITLSLYALIFIIGIIVAVAGAFM